MFQESERLAREDVEGSAVWSRVTIERLRKPVEKDRDTGSGVLKTECAVFCYLD